MPREILVDWVTASGAGKVSVFWAPSLDPVAPQRLAIYNLINNFKTVLDDGVTCSVRTDGRDLDDATGALLGVWSETTNRAVGGIASGESVADATQVLLRWQTGTIVGRRFLTGRTFIPGLSASKLVSGNLSAAAVSTIQSAIDTYVSGAGPSGVWHRPIAGSGGSFHEVVSGSVWSELAVLRRRRG